MLTRWVLGSLVTWIDWWPIRGHGEELVSPVSDVNYKLTETRRNVLERPVQYRSALWRLSQSPF